MTNKELFAYWVLERERVRHRKEWEQPKPWSEDPIFQATYFCNVRREDDRVTKWIRENYRPALGPPTDDDYIVPNMVMARLVNKPQTLYALGWPFPKWKPRIWNEVMREPGSWGSAYIVSTNGRKQPKHQYIAGLLEQAFERFGGATGATLPGTLAGAHRRIQALQGMGSFMAAQVVADLKNTPGHPLQLAEDFKTFAAPGPGSLRGLGWFHEEKITPSKFDKALASARTEMQNSSAGSLIASICNQDLQNCFCEYDKYMRIHNGTGRSKRKYPGRV